MAIKKYKAKITGTHAVTGVYLEQGKEYEMEESLAGSEIFEEVKPNPSFPDRDGESGKKKKEKEL